MSLTFNRISLCIPVKSLYKPIFRNRSAYSVKKVLSEYSFNHQNLLIKGWVRAVREHKHVVFLNVQDGSCSESIQVAVSPDDIPSTATYGSAVEVEGQLVKSLGNKQAVDLQAEKIRVVGSCDAYEYPFKVKKKHPPDYLRQLLHLRPRTNSFSSLLRVRNAATCAIHDFFQKDGYLNIHTPILTSNDCEGAGEVFQVEPADKTLVHITQKAQDATDDSSGGESSDEGTSKHFFNVPTFLTVSGQLHLEVMAGAFTNVYTFSPTFRAENCRSRLHLSEFYMLEAEIAFLSQLQDMLKVIEDLVKYVGHEIMDHCEEDVNFISNSSSDKSLKDHRKKLLESPYKCITYTEAIDILQSHSKKLVTPVQWGCDLQKEHEWFLVDYCDGVPVFVTDFPKDIKPFYMRENSDDKTVAAVDLLVHDVGELVGGSLREERLDLLQQKLIRLGLDKAYDYYLDLRRFGSTPHGGFGLGFERLLQAFLGIPNIKDTIPFPRFTHNCKL